jgi:hypothetical protein
VNPRTFAGDDALRSGFFHKREGGIAVKGFAYHLYKARDGFGGCAILPKTRHFSACEFICEIRDKNRLTKKDPYGRNRKIINDNGSLG